VSVNLHPASSFRRRPRHSDGKLLDAACKVFARDGYLAATMDAIAAEAGSTKPTLYARFGSKLDLYELTVRREADALLLRLFSAYTDAEAKRAEPLVQAAVGAWFTYVADRPDAFALLFSPDRSGPAARVAEEALDAVAQRLGAIVERVRGRGGPGAPTLISAMIVGSATQAARRLLVDPKMDPAAAARLTTSFILAAMRGLDRAPVEPPR
jgi:AcrR family transcriptional regulator